MKERGNIIVFILIGGERIASDGTFRIAQMKGINNTEPAYEDYVRAARI